MLRRLLPLVVVLVPLVAAAPAAAALRLDTDTSHESLLVAADGRAQVTYSAHGTTRTVLVTGSTVRYGGTLAASAAAKRVTPTVPFAIAQYALPNGEQFALERFHRTGQFGQLGPLELFIARWSGDPTVLTLTIQANRLCGTATYHGAAFSGGAHSSSGNPLDALGRNVYFDAQRATGWYRMEGVLTRPLGFALYLRSEIAGTAYRALVVGPNSGGDLAPVATAQTPASTSGTCPFGPGTYKGQ
jgi:hypothetical protein